MNIKHQFVNAFLVFYVHKIRYSKNMNKETKLKKTDKYNKTNIQMK